MNVCTVGRAYLDHLYSTGQMERGQALSLARALVDDRTVELVDTCTRWWSVEDLNIEIVVDASTLNAWVDALNTCAALADRTDPLGERLCACSLARLSTLGILPE